MPRDWLVFDVSYIAWRAFHSVGNRDPVQSILSTVMEFERLSDHFASRDLVFAFDRKPYLRKDIFKGYKKSRDEKKYVDEMEAATEDEFLGHVTKLRTDYIPDMGYRNVFSKKGYEADDIMAAVVQGLPDDDRAILISGDEDLYQLLSRRAAVYHPKSGRFITAKSFKEEHQIHPLMWAQVKALAGCVSDDITGMKGVGPITALKFFREELVGTTRHINILTYNRTEEYALNNKLTTLPFPGLDPLTPEPDDSVMADGIDRLSERLGIQSASWSKRQSRRGVSVE